jgi:dTDP-4-dehydrorhamnose reductase
MIVGRGLIATAFKKSLFDHHSFVVFASGVSNSTESDPGAYAREWELLASTITKNTTLIYFSTISIFDPTKTVTPYIRHKISIERLIQEKAESYLIVRLPILVGRTDNPHTLINYLTNAIREHRPIELHALACRYLLDIDDLIPLLTPYGFDKTIRLVLNIPGSKKITVPELVNKIQERLQTEGIFTWQNTGACYDIPNDSTETIYLESENYVDDLLRKYLS